MNRTVFSEKVDAYRNQLYITAFTILKNEADAQDAVCSAILKAYENLDSLKDEKKFKAWIITITRNEALQIMRKRIDLPGDRQVESMLPPVSDNYNELWDVVQNLSDDYRIVIVMFYYNDLSIKDISKMLEIPVGTVKSRLNRGREQIKKALGTFPEKNVGHTKKTGMKLMVITAVLVLTAAVGTFTVRSRADIIDALKMTLLDVFGNVPFDDDPNDDTDSSEDIALSEEEIRKEDVAAKKDLMIELRETIVDSNGIYALLQITAPSDIELNKNITFDYFAFCEGTNFNLDNVIGGAVSCDFLESTKDRPNVALYVMKLTGNVSDYEGKSIVACMKDLTVNPNSENSKVIVEGVWSVSFAAEKTIRDSIELSDFLDDEEVIIPYITKEAKVVGISLSPLSIALTTDVSEVPFDELGVSDTTISLSLLMSDGEVLNISPYSETKRNITESGESEFDQVEGVSYQKDIYSFAEPVDVNKVAGIYVQGVFVPVN